MPFPMLNSVFDGLYPAGDQWYWRADFVKEIPDEAVARHVEFGEKLPTWKSTMHLYPINGAAHRVGPTEHAVGLPRRQLGHGHGRGRSRPGRTPTRSIEWAAATAMRCIRTRPAAPYVNMMMEEGQDRVAASYGDNYERLAEIKAKYDPDNLFHVNQNIKPA